MNQDIKKLNAQKAQILESIHMLKLELEVVNLELDRIMENEYERQLEHGFTKT